LVWKEVAKAAKAGEYSRASNPLKAIASLEEALQKASAFDLPSFVEPSGLLARWRGDYQATLMNGLKTASTIKQLETALQNVEDACPTVQLEDSGLAFYREELSRLRQPCAMHVSTLSGAEGTVEVHRTDTVAIVRDKVGKEMELKPYRIKLACSAARLEPDSATLEELGLCNCEVEEVALFFGEIDRWQEMSIAEFLELAVSLKIISAESAASDQLKFDSGKSSRAQVQTPGLTMRIEQVEQERQVSRKREEDARKKREDEQTKAEEKLQKAKQDLLAEVREQFQIPPHEVACGHAAMHHNLQRKAAEASEAIRQVTQTLEEVQLDINQQLEPALPALQKAVEDLRRLKKADICELQCLKRPPSLVLLTMQALCILFEIRPIKIPSPDGWGKVDDYWTASRRSLLSDHHLLQRMLEFDKDNIPEQVILRLAPLMHDPQFMPEHCKKCSLFSAAVCGWIRSVVAYHFNVVELGPAFKYSAAKRNEKEELVYHQEVIQRVISDFVAESEQGRPNVIL